MSYPKKKKKTWLSLKSQFYWLFKLLWTLWWDTSDVLLFNCIQCFEQCFPNSPIAEWSSKRLFFFVFGYYILKWVIKRSLNREINLTAHISNFLCRQKLWPVWYPYLNNNFHISNTLTHLFTYMYLKKTTKISSQTTLPNTSYKFELE